MSSRRCRITTFPTWQRQMSLLKPTGLYQIWLVSEVVQKSLFPNYPRNCQPGHSKRVEHSSTGINAIYHTSNRRFET
jgi:hypothetical protein